MAEVINLNRFRKAKTKAEAASAAETNRVAFGRTKAEKEAARRERDKAAKDLDGKKVED